MFTFQVRKNAAKMQRYYRDHFTGKAAQGVWLGKGAERLGLKTGEPVEEAQFEALAVNLHPSAQTPLTVRTPRDRRVALDLAATPPKVVDVLESVGGDERIGALREAALQAPLAELERLAETRVRVGGRDTTRRTGELVIACMADRFTRSGQPGSHNHLCAFNATYDPVEGRWKALEAGAMAQKLRFVTAVHHAELAAGLVELGYRIKRLRHGFTVEGLDLEIARRLSSRSEDLKQAEQGLAKKLGRDLTNNERARLVRRLRPIKQDESVVAAANSSFGLSTAQTAHVREVVRGAQNRQVRPHSISADESIRHACDHLFERLSVVERTDILMEALRFGLGSVRLGDVAAALKRRTDLVVVGERVTTLQHQREEQALEYEVRRRHGSHAPLLRTPPLPPILGEEQSAALRAMTASTDGVFGLSGKAGTGKTTVLAALRGAVEAAGLTFQAVAPTTAAVDVLHREGFRTAWTVQSRLLDAAPFPDLLLVDETNMLSVPQLRGLLEMARTKNSRVLLCGDSGQHHAVPFGDGFRFLEERNAIRATSLTQIRRQRVPTYRAAVAAVAKGDLDRGWEHLKSMNAVVKTDNPAAIVEDYVRATKSGRSTLIVAPTWNEIAKVTEELRSRLRSEGQLAKEEAVVESHRALPWTLAQARDLRNYRPGLVLNFHRRTKQFAPGSWATVASVRDDHLLLKSRDGEWTRVTAKQAASFSVCERVELGVSKGDRLLLRGNLRQRGLFNGQVVDVAEVGKDGAVTLTDGRVLGSEFRLFTHGYATTSHSAESRTVDVVLISMPKESLGMMSHESFYVALSRGRFAARIYTDDLDAVKKAVRMTGARETATQFLAKTQRIQFHAAQKR